MTRLTAAIILSVALHLVLLAALPVPRTRDDREVIRVSLLEAREPEPEAPQNTSPLQPHPQKANQPLVKKKDVIPRKPQKKEKKEPAEKPPAESAEETREKTEETIEEFYPEPEGEVPDGESFGTDRPGRFGQSESQAPSEAGARDGAGPSIIDVSRLIVTKKIQPQYPMISRKRRDQGTVTLLVTIKAGRVASIEVERSSGHGPLDESAVRAVREWEFDSSGYGDTVVARIPFAFSLQ